MNYKLVTITIPIELNKRVDDYCKSTGRKKSSLIKVLLEQELEKEK